MNTTSSERCDYCGHMRRYHSPACEAQRLPRHGLNNADPEAFTRCDCVRFVRSQED